MGAPNGCSDCDTMAFTCDEYNGKFRFSVVLCLWIPARGSLDNLNVSSVYLLGPCCWNAVHAGLLGGCRGRDSNCSTYGRPSLHKGSTLCINKRLSAAGVAWNGDIAPGAKVREWETDAAICALADSSSAVLKRVRMMLPKESNNFPPE